MRSNLTRLNYLAMTTILAHCVMLLQIWSTEITPDLQFWKTNLFVSHIILITYMTMVFLITYRYRNSEQISPWMEHLPMLSAAIIMGVGTNIAVVDQLITSSITPLIIASITTGTVILMRPVYSFIIFGFAYFFYFNLLENIVVEEAILLSNQLNGFSIIGIGLLLSIIFWRYFYRTTVQKKYIEKQRKQLERMAYSDSLTQLPNRRYFDALLKREVIAIQKNAHVSTILMLDIDDFKQVNDDYGHPTGDKVLVEFSNLLSETIRSDDIVARFGGEEFIILMPDISATDSLSYAEKLREAIQNHLIFIGQDTLAITASFGVVQLDKENYRFTKLYRRLDQALSEAKEKGKNQVVLSRHV